MNELLKTLSILALASALTGCGSDDDDGGSNDSGDAQQPAAFTETTVVGASDAAGSFLLEYEMPGISGDTRTEKAVVLIPGGDVPDNGWPVIGWGHGTTGIADVCAPSQLEGLAGYAAYLNVYLSSGYAIVAPDYEGLGTEGPHPFLNLQSEGRSINYAVAAAVAEFESLADRYVAIGHSQGGHAALGAGATAAENSEIALVGVVAIAPASQIRAQGEALQDIFEDPQVDLQRRIEAGVGQLGFSALLIDAVTAVSPDFDVSSVYGSNGGPVRTAAETGCLDQVRDSLAQTVPGVLNIDGNLDSLIDSDAADLPEFASYLNEAEPGNSVIPAQVLILQGTADTTVFPTSTQALVQQLTAVNTQAPELEVYDGATHSTILAVSQNDILNFLVPAFAAQ